MNYLAIVVAAWVAAAAFADAAPKPGFPLRFDFKQPGGAQSVLGADKLQRIALKHQWRSVEDLAKKLEREDDLVSTKDVTRHTCVKQ